MSSPSALSNAAAATQGSPSSATPPGMSDSSAKKDGATFANRGIAQRARPPDSPEEGEVPQQSSPEKSEKPYEDEEDDEKTEEELDNSTGETTTSSEEEGEIDENEPVKPLLLVPVPSKDESERANNNGSEMDAEQNLKTLVGEKISEQPEDEIDENDHDDESDDDEEQGDTNKEDDEEMEDTENEETGKMLEDQHSRLPDQRTDTGIEKLDVSEMDEATSLAVAAANDLLAVSAAPVVAPLVRESFLSDSLTEEERRTRTRYIPAVEGMHSLKRLEVKRDLLLARSLPGVTPSVSSKFGSSKSKSSQRETPPSDDYAMEDADNDDNSNDQMLSKDKSNLMEDDRDDGYSIGLKGGTRKLNVMSNTEIVVPSKAFRPPPPLKDSSDLDEAKGERSGGVKRAAPGEVESITAFNPPRLPESISLKKKHRMLRWQRRPADMDTDLGIYQQTVQKQRDELKHAETEFQRIQTIDNHLRRHLLQHIKCLNEEMAFVNKELAAEQLKCLKATEWYLPTSRARGRNDGKTGSKAMKDIIHGLRRLDVELTNKRDLLKLGSTEDKPEDPPAGVGGVSGKSFMEWQRNTEIKSCKFASAWVVPNDKVILPTFGGIEGTVARFFPYSSLDVNEAPPEDLFPKKLRPAGTGMMSMHPFGSPTTAMHPRSHPSFVPKFSPRKKKMISGPPNEEDKSPFRKMIAPRFAVRLSFGVGFFSVDSLMSKEDPSTYTNERLAERWKGLIETAAVVAPTLDIGAMVNKTSKEVSAAIQEYERSLNTDDSREPVRNEDQSAGTSDNCRLVPFDSGLLPTASARGSLIEKSSMAELNYHSNKLFHGGKGVLGHHQNLGVTVGVRELEDQNQEYLNNQAKVLQLRNQLYRQRRIRMLNEKTYNATKERAARVEALVAEMRSDLKTLKARLDDEIRELGISEETAETILTSYYSSLDVNQSATPSGSRRRSRMTAMEEDEAIPEEGEMQVDSTQ